VLLITTICTFVYPIIIASLGEPDMAVVVAGYVGFFLLGSVMVAIGIFLSAITTSQITAAVSTLAALFFLNILASFAGDLPDVWYGWALRSISVFSRFDDFSMGIIGFSPVLYFLTIDALFVFLTVRVIEKRRWSE
jgi:ABC-2 type transport system permease protein